MRSQLPQNLKSYNHCSLAGQALTGESLAGRDCTHWTVFCEMPYESRRTSAQRGPQMAHGVAKEVLSYKEIGDHLNVDIFHLV